jgi:hypothetical protein
MISPSVLLTAAHCVADVKFGQQVTMFYGPTHDPERTQQGIRWGVDPDFCPDCASDAADIGFVELTLDYAESFPAPVPLVYQDEWDEVMHAGQAVGVVGYGIDEQGENNIKRSLATEIASVADSGLAFEYGNESAGACAGDSGAPVFTVLENGDRRLVGVHSRAATPGCPGPSIAETPYPSLCWLRDQTGVDLLPAGDEDCDRLDIGETGCAVGAPSRQRSGGRVLFLLVGLVLVGCRRSNRA